MTGRKIYILIAVVILGILLIAQIKSFSGLNTVFLRDSQSNIFNEIKILKDKNSDLRKEISDLESTLKQFEDQNLALQVIEEEILKYKKLSGKYSIFGPGVAVKIDGKLNTPWIVDLVNEFFNTGALAIDVNGIRIINKTAGFDTLPQGQILLNGSILSSPYEFKLIGESSNIINILELPGGIFDRLEASVKDVKINTSAKEIISMN